MGAFQPQRSLSKIQATEGSVYVMSQLCIYSFAAVSEYFGELNLTELNSIYHQESEEVQSKKYLEIKETKTVYTCREHMKEDEDIASNNSHVCNKRL